MINKNKPEEYFYCICDGNEMRISAWTDHTGKHKICFAIGDEDNDESKQVVINAIQAMKIINYMYEALDL